MKRIVLIIGNCIQFEFKANAEGTGDNTFVIKESDFRKENEDLISIMVMYDRHQVFAKYKGFTFLLDILATEENEESTYISCKCDLFNAGIVIKPIKEDCDSLFSDIAFNGNPF